MHHCSSRHFHFWNIFRATRTSRTSGAACSVHPYPFQFISSLVSLTLIRPVNTMATPKWGRYPVRVTAGALDSAAYDSIIVVSPGSDHVKRISPLIQSSLLIQSQIDESVEKEGCVMSIDLPAKRLVYAPTGPTDRDFDDIRRYADAAEKGIKRAIGTGSKKPLLAVMPSDKYPNAALVSILGAFQALYVPLQYREDVPEKSAKIEELGIYFGPNPSETAHLIKLALSLESGRFVARDIGGGDPERMAPPRVAEYVINTFAGTPVSVKVIDDVKVFEKEYPLFAAVNRAASVIERHQGRIIYLEYKGEGPITKTIMPCGKGVTYDTGGADIKAGGIMAGMSRDKCGAAAVAGFFQILAELKPKGIKAIGAMAVVRNSVGENCYVSDEVIVTRAGLRVRIGNTDAEGRNVMTDPLCRLKELALNEVNPHLMTIATLTGHVCLALGSYTASIDNGPSKKENFTRKIQEAGDAMGDMIEVSTLRREDYCFIKSTADGEDLLQCNNAASSRTPRGHQFPAAFMIEASGLDKHGCNSKEPLKYTHFDIAGAAGDFPSTPTAAPLLALAKWAFGEEFKF